jgi:hypothetical protein
VGKYLTRQHCKAATELEALCMTWTSGNPMPVGKQAKIAVRG